MCVFPVAIQEVTCLQRIAEFIHSSFGFDDWLDIVGDSLVVVTHRGEIPGFKDFLLKIHQLNDNEADQGRAETPKWGGGSNFQKGHHTPVPRRSVDKCVLYNLSCIPVSYGQSTYCYLVTRINRLECVPVYSTVSSKTKTSSNKTFTQM